VFTRPALKKALPSAIAGTPTIVSLRDFQLPSGDALTMFLDSNGLVWSNDSDNPADTTNLLTVTPGVQFKAETAFGKQWYAFFGGPQAALFSDSPFVGVDPPAYFNGTNFFRVTTDAPGAPPNFSSAPTTPFPLLGPGSGTLTISSTTAGGYTTESPGYSFWTTLTYNCTLPVPASWLGQIITASGLTNSQFFNPNFAGYVIAINGNSYTVAINWAAPYWVDISGQSGTATYAINYLARQKNLVTAYLGASALPQMTPGYWVSVLNSDNSLINGPDWTITSISRATSGLVTVTISTQLANLPVGSQVYVASADTTDFPNGYQTVYQVISSTGGTTVFTYESLNSAAATDTSGGSVYQTWSPQFGTNGNAGQIVNSGFDANGNFYIQYFQLGPDATLASTGGTPQVQVQSQAAAGPRSAVVMFKSQDGAITAPSVPIDLVTIGGGNLLLAQNVPLGPFGTVQRLIAFTPAEGANFYYITPATVPEIGAQGPVIALGTIVNDNVTTTAVMEFSDSQLTAGTQIDIAGNDLFNQVVLAPCLGNVEYQGRIAWFGEINNVKNFLNMGFDGGYNPPSGTCYTTGAGYSTIDWVMGSLFQVDWVGATAFIGGKQVTVVSVPTNKSMTVTGAILSEGNYTFQVNSPYGALPPGWDASEGDGLGTLIGWPQTELPGFAYQLVAGSNSKIQQSAYHDPYGAPILLPNTPYIFRFKALRSGINIPSLAALNIDVYSPSQGILLSRATPLLLTSIATAAWTWYTFEFQQQTPATIPSDAVLRIYFSGATEHSYSVAVDEGEFIYADQPVSYDQVRVSYYQNPFGYDAITGILSVDPSQSITGAFGQRGYLYLIGGDGRQSLFQAQNSGTGEPVTWDVTEYSSNCGCSGPCAVDSTEDEAIWVGRYGCRSFDGSPNPKKISQAWATTFESMNWAVQTTIWVKIDPVDRLVFFGIPTGTAGTPNLVAQMSYRLNDATYNVPDEVHVSGYTGKMIATDLARRWSPWNRTLNCADMCTRPLLNGNPGTAKTIVFGGGNGLAIGSGTGFGNLYVLDTYDYFPLNPSLGTWNCADDDYGEIPMYYTTYFFFNHDLEQQPLIGQFRKLFNFLAVHALGIGSIKITPLLDALQNAQTVLPLTPLSLTDPGFDLEFHMIVKGNRVAFRVEPYIGSPGVSKALALTHLIVSARKDLVFPIRGTIFFGG
jgi:hypothetical protein